MIILIRHALPDIDYSRCCVEIAEARLKEYNSTEKLRLNQIVPLKNELSSVVPDQEKAIIYASNLPRAITTARYLFDPSIFDININPIFSEFELAIMKVPFVRFSLKNWFFISRIAWCLGFHQNCSSFKKEVMRAKKAMDLLKASSDEGKTIVLVGHGFMNRCIKIYLKKEGWVVPQDKRYGDLDILLPG